jgi:outer membrane protein assembly factor BamB
LNVCLRRTCISLVFVFFIPVFFTLLLLTVPVFAEGTLTWEQSEFDELSKGTAQGVAIRSSGGLELAPAFKALATTPSAYIWAIASDPQGNLYAAAGGPARVYRITPDGKSTTIFEPQELQVQALAVGKGGVIYAATNPDGKVYKLERKPAGKGGEKASDAGSWSSSVYFNPDTKYIWDLLLDQAGNLYVATGDRGEIFRVTPKGEHSVFFTSDEPHIRVLALDA